MTEHRGIVHGKISLVLFRKISAVNTSQTTNWLKVKLVILTTLRHNEGASKAIRPTRPEN